jgi:hypothetical protein
MDQPATGFERIGGNGPAALSPPERQGMARALDPVVTIGAVQRYVESERSRNRRMVLWTSTLFLLVFLVVLVLFIAVGIFVLRSSNRTVAAVDRMQDQTVVYATEVLGISNRMMGVEGAQSAIASKVREADEQRYRDAERLKSDLEKFGRWVESRTGSRLVDEASMDARIKELEQVAAANRKDLEEIRRRYADLKSSVFTSASNSTSVAQDFAVPPAENVPPSVVRKPEPLENLSPEMSDKIVAESKSVVAEEVPPVMPSPGPREISVVTFPNGDRYEGEFKDGLMSGWGTYSYHNGDRYEGQFKEDMKEGRGVFFYKNGDRYTGDFSRDMKQGKGSYVYQNGDRLTGEFGGDMANGQGTMIYKNGNRYSGLFRNGLKHGNGILTYANGDVYKGEFRDDVRQGKGAYIFSDGSRYTGEFKDGRRHGSGIYVYAGGEQYAGEFRNGQKEGTGTLTYPGGKTVKGIWKNDRFLHPVSEN